MLFALNAFPVARFRSAIALFRSVCAFNSSPRAVVNAVCRSSTRNVVDCPASSFRCSLANCCSLASSVATAARTGRWTVGPLVRGPHYDWSVPVRVPVVRGNDTRFVLTAVVDPEAFISLLGRHRIPAGWVVATTNANKL